MLPNRERHCENKVSRLRTQQWQRFWLALELRQTSRSVVETLENRTFHNFYPIDRRLLDQTIISSLQTPLPKD